MRWSFKIARVAGTVVQVHVTFLLLLGWLAGSYYLKGGTQAAIDGTLFILLIFGCVLLHEFGHALAARGYGIPTPTITLLPIGGVAHLQRMPDEPGEELVVAAAGPLVNVAIAGLLWVGLGAEANLEGLAHLEEMQYGMFEKLFAVNIFIVLFNLIPAFPMDGGRMLRALLAFRLPYARATRIAATIGQSLAFVFGFMGLFGNPLLLLIALFVYLGAGQEAAMVEMREATKGLVVEEAMLGGMPALEGSETAEQTARMLVQSGQSALPVTREGRPRGLVFRNDAFRAMQQGDREATAESLMSADIPTVLTTDVLDAALEKMRESGHSTLPVVDDAGGFVGLLSAESLGDMLMFRSPRIEETT